MSGEANPGLATVSLREIFENPVQTVLDQHAVKEGFEEVKEIKVSFATLSSALPPNPLPPRYGRGTSTLHFYDPC